jgi:hypothetical protein
MLRVSTFCSLFKCHCWCFQSFLKYHFGQLMQNRTFCPQRQQQLWVWVLSLQGET